MSTAAPLVRPPRLRVAESAEGRRATWFEVFSDLVFVVAISELARNLVAGPTVLGLFRFAGLVVPAWWAWVLFTHDADRLDTNGVPFRLITPALLPSWSGDE